MKYLLFAAVVIFLSTCSNKGAPDCPKCGEKSNLMFKEEGSANIAECSFEDCGTIFEYVGDKVMKVW